MTYRPEDLPARFADKIQIDGNGCWLWTGHLGLQGYGTTSYPPVFGLTRSGNLRSCLSHRLVYEFLVGPIPDGLQIDHLCRVTSCCNPAHLEPVTASVNMFRRWHGSGYIQAATGTQLSFDEIVNQAEQIKLL